MIGNLADTDACDFANAKIVNWKPVIEGPTQAGLLRTDGNHLDPAVQDALVADGMPLMHLPVAVKDAMTAGAKANGLPVPAELTPEGLSCFLVSASKAELANCLGSTLSIIGLLRFILQIQGSGNANLANIKLLRGTPLMLLADKSSACFGEDDKLWPSEPAKLLLASPRSFVHDQVAVELSRVHSSVELGHSPAGKSASTDMVVRKCREHIKVRPMDLSDLLMHKEAIRNFKMAEPQRRDDWNSAFWEFLAPKDKDLDEESFINRVQQLERDFGDWEVLKVASAQSDLQMVALENARSTFNLGETDKKWHDSLRRVLNSCNINVLHDSHLDYKQQIKLLRKIVPDDDVHLIRFLKHAMPEIERLPGVSRLESNHVLTRDAD